MRLLLDTHIWLWVLLEPQKLSRRSVKAIESTENELWLSPVSVWEFFLLVRKRRITLNEDPDPWLRKAMAALPLLEATLTGEVAVEAGKLKLQRKDPADHFLIATAKVFELTLLTADATLLQSRAVRTLANK